MPGDFYYEWTHRIRHIWREVIAQADEEGIGRQEAKETAAEQIRDLIDNDLLKVPVDTAINAALDQADKKDNQESDKVIARAIRGEDILDLDGDPGLDIVVALGDGLRKSLRSITADDLRVMDQLRYKNLRDVSNAYDEWRQTFDAALSPVTRRGTFGAAVESGEFA